MPHECMDLKRARLQCRRQACSYALKELSLSATSGESFSRLVAAMPRLGDTINGTGTYISHGMDISGRQHSYLLYVPAGGWDLRALTPQLLFRMCQATSGSCTLFPCALGAEDSGGEDKRVSACHAKSKSACAEKVL